MLWTQVLAAIVGGVPVVLIAGIVVLLAVGGIMGCAECVMSRFGAARFTPGVVRPLGHRMMPT